MIKSVQKHKELPVDFICLHLYFLQKSIYTDIQCSRAGFGNYQLKKEFNFAKLDPEDIQLPKLGGTPNDILEQVRIKMKEINEFQNIATTHSDATEITSNNETHVLSDSESKLNDDTINTNNGIQVDEILLDKNATTIDDKSMSERKGKEKNLSQQSLTKYVIDNDLIKYVASLNSFLVEGIKGTKRVVTLQPKESCSCPSTGLCYHIQAVKQAPNIEKKETNKSVKNLTLLRKNVRPRVARIKGLIVLRVAWSIQG